MNRFHDLLRRVDEALAEASARGGDAVKIADLAEKRVELERALTASEEAWFELSAEAEADMSGSAFETTGDGGGSSCCRRLASALAAEPAPWPDSFVGRLEALALIESLNADLLGHDSATLTLERWCADHRLADPARIVAERVHDVDKAGDRRGARRARRQAGRTARLSAGQAQVRRPRAVGGRQLVCAGAADAGNEPCAGDDRHAVRQGGRGAALPPPHAVGGFALAPAAEGLGDGRGGGSGRKGALAVPDHVLEHRAVLSLPDGEPFSEVVETYTGEVLAFPPPNE